MAGRSGRNGCQEENRKLSNAEEQVLEEWILKLHKMGVPATIMMMQEIADHLLSRNTIRESEGDLTVVPAVRKNGVQKFERRHPMIQAVWSRRIASERFEAMDSVLFNDWFDLFKSVVEEHEILANNTYNINMDEKGCIMGMISNSKVLVSTRAKHEFLQQAGTRESVTVIECVSGVGEAIPPLIIWSAKTHRNAWYPIGLDPRVRFGISPNVYTDDELGAEWLEKCFHPRTKENAGEGNRLLIMDGHGSHLTGRFLSFCLENKIVPLCVPAHTIHVLQPLDVGCFGLVAHHYRHGVGHLSRHGNKM